MRLWAYITRAAEKHMGIKQKGDNVPRSIRELLQHNGFEMATPEKECEEKCSAAGAY